jgi:hypothetical protein
MQLKGAYNVPKRRVRGFVGREDCLERLKRSVLDPIDSSTRIIVIRGMGGQGKTQIALEFCHRGLKESLFSACVWVDATSESTARKSLEAIFELIRPKEFEAQNSDARIRFVLTTLSGLKSSWLMVFDNYDDPFAFADVQDFFPESAHGAMLFTTRHADTETLASDDCAIELGCLQSGEATDLLIRQKQASAVQGKCSTRATHC